MNINRVMLGGNLTRDPELRYVPSGKAVVNITLAVNRKYKSQGELKEEVSFVRVLIWGKTAELTAEYVKKGDPLFVEGRLKTRSWETDEGRKRTILEVIAERVHFIGHKKKAEDKTE